MPLEYPGEWKFAGPDEVPEVEASVASRFCKLLVDISACGGDQQGHIEEFKSRFGNSSTSSSLSYAEYDLSTAMLERASNSVSFIESLWLSIEYARSEGLKTPSERQVNTRLREGGVPFQIKDGVLSRVIADVTIVAPSGATPSASSPVPAYQLGDVIGRGGFGVVHHATRETSAAVFDYAFKLLDPSPFVANPEKAVVRFQREIRAVQRLQHRAIVPYVDAGIDPQGRPYLVMPLIKGPNIRQATRGMDVRAVVDLVCEVLSGLEYAHSNNVLHRDLKPSNILVRESDHQPIILDFGAAFVLDDLDSKSLTSAAIGTIGYIPSEVIEDRTLRSVLHDVYSCAVITYELIAGRRPNPQDYVDLLQRRQDLSDELDDVIMLSSLDDLLKKALGPAAARPPSAGALRHALLAVVRGAADGDRRRDGLRTSPATGVTMDKPSTQTAPERSSVKKAPPGRMSFKDKRAMGESSLTADAVLRKILSAYVGGLKRCHKELLKTDPTARGKVKLSFIVDEIGRAVRPKVSGFNARLDSCIEGQISNWRFDVPRDNDGQPMEASFEIALQLVPE